MSGTVPGAGVGTSLTCHNRGLPDDELPPAAAAAAPDHLPALRSGPPNAVVRNLVVGSLIVLVVASWVSDTYFFAYHDEHPLIFIALNARNRNLVLATTYLDAWSYYIVGTLRLLVSDPLFYLLGIWYGDAAVRWMERKSPTYGSLMRGAEQWFGKAAYPLVAIAPNNFICLFAGASGMSVPIFLALNVSGTVVRLWLLRQLGDFFSTPLRSLSTFIQDHRLAVLGVSIAIVAFTVWNERRRGGGEISELTHLEAEINRGDVPKRPSG